ncbi:hypothetical protein [Bathymodiolus septemdierum thioautotrophic gill symbiont]|uniref:hypothetical protein n=1 Tax=Bathymodiolus septemdierum thioautotrophic gill symbiont TaxID=113267 RepID=UPI0012ED7B74|nr:hypothetical protein [Bathymodiolus septemdierum thioautotrophic gill symbiont]
MNSNCHFAYADAKPADAFNGNFTADRQINNINNSKLWIKATSHYPTVVIPNEE